MLGVISAGLLVPPVIGASLALGLHISDSSCVHRESASTSAGVSDASDPDSSLLDTGREMDRKLRVLTWDLSCRWLKAVSLYVMGSLGCNVYDAVEQVLSRELGSLSDSVGELHCKVGVSATTSSSVTGGAGASRGAEGTLSSSEVILALGEGFMWDRCQSKSSTDRVALALGAWADL